MTEAGVRIGDYVVRPDTHGWIVSRMAVKRSGKNVGEEYEADTVYPGRLDQALRKVLDRMVADGLEPGDDIERAVATVAHLYATIGSTVADEQREQGERG